MGEKGLYRIDASLTYESGINPGRGLLLDVKKAEVRRSTIGFCGKEGVSICLQGKGVFRSYYGSPLRKVYLRLPPELALQLCWTILGAVQGLQPEWERTWEAEEKE